MNIPQFFCSTLAGSCDVRGRPQSCYDPSCTANETVVSTISHDTTYQGCTANETVESKEGPAFSKVLGISLEHVLGGYCGNGLRSNPMSVFFQQIDKLPMYRMPL